VEYTYESVNDLIREYQETVLFRALMASYSVSVKPTNNISVGSISINTVK